MPDARVTGAWIRHENGQPADSNEQLRVLAYPDNTYLAHYTVDDKDLYFRAYPVEVAGLSLVQLKLVGTHEGPPADDVQRLYQLMSYQLEGDELTVRTINSRLLGEELDTREALLEALVRHRNNSELLVNPMEFIRLKTGAG